MQTSNKIFISFLIFLFGGITLLYIGAKYYQGYDDLSYFDKQEKKTKPFKVIVLAPNARLNIKNGKEFKFSQWYKKGTKPDLKIFEIKNDTLFVFALKKIIITNSRSNIPEVSCKNVKYIIAKENSIVSLTNYQSDSLFVTLNKAYFHCTSDKKNVFVNFDAKYSDISINNEYLENISVMLYKSEFYNNNKKGFKTITGFLRNNSHIKGTIIGKINLDIDHSSAIND
jgi:hypothetical protein